MHKNYFQNANKVQKKKSLESKSGIDYYLNKISKCYFSGKNLWLIKPSGYNRGFGVELFDNVKELRNKMQLLLKGYLEILQTDSEEIKRSNKSIKSRKFIIQKYIERPFLYQQKKFDMRFDYFHFYFDL